MVSEDSAVTLRCEIWSSNKDAEQTSKSQEKDLICLNTLMYIVFSFHSQ